MKSIFPAVVLLSSLTLSPLLAQAPAPAVTPAPVPAELPIPAPPGGGIVRVEVNASDDDLLGVVKSMLRVANFRTASAVAQAASRVSGGPQGEKAAAQLKAMDAKNASLDTSLADVLKDVTRLHMIVIETPQTAPPPMTAPRPAPPTRPGVKAAPPAALTPAALPPTPGPELSDFYEKAFSGEGGKRVIYVNMDETRVVMTSFGKANGFAFTVAMPGGLVVARANGYPSFDKLADLASAIANSVGTETPTVAPPIVVTPAPPIIVTPPAAPSPR